MIIECVNCSKKFDVNSDLIPSNGRTIQCGSCGHVWFYKKNDQNQVKANEIEFQEKITNFTKMINLKILHLNLLKEKKIEQKKDHYLRVRN